jgi:hypothetical protein
VWHVDVGGDPRFQIVRSRRGGARVGFAFDGQKGLPSVVNCCKFIRVAYAVSYICIHRVF